MAVCASCGHEAVGEFWFPPACGLPAGHAVTDGTRKTVSVVFCDLVGSTALWESNDLEAALVTTESSFEASRSVWSARGTRIASETSSGLAILSAAGKIVRLLDPLGTQPAWQSLR